MKSFFPLALVLCSVPAWAQNPLSVHVVDAKGAPIAGAQVQVRLWSGSATYLTPKATDARGNVQFELAALPDGKSLFASIIAGAKGFAFNTGKVVNGKSEVRLERGAPWRGKVVDEAGKPLAGATVALHGTRVGDDFSTYILLPEEQGVITALYSTQTQADGSFVLDNAPANKDLLFGAVHPEFVRKEGRDAQVGVEEQIQLSRAGSLHGRALDTQGKPIANLKVVANGRSSSEATTDASGNFTIGSLAPGSYNVRAQVPNLAPYLLERLTDVRVDVGKTAEVGPWQAKKSVLIRGIVRDADTRKPLAKASVAAADSYDAARNSDTIWDTSDAAGRFALRVLPGTYRVRLSGAPSGYLRAKEQQEVEVSATGRLSGQPLEFGLKPAPIIHGVTLDERDQPVAAQLSVGFTGTIDTDDRGRWQYTPQSAEGFGLGGGTSKTGYFEVVSPKKVEWPVTKPITVTVRYKPWHNVSGRVVTPEGTPVEGARIEAEYLVSTGDGYWTGNKVSATTDQDGRYVLAQMRGTTDLKVLGKKAGFEFQSGGTVSRQGDAVNISDLVFTPLGGKVEGTTQPGALVLIAGREASADERGHFTFEGIPSKEQTAFAAKNDLFGSATGTTAFDIKLQTLSPQAQDKALAEQMWADIKNKGRNTKGLQEWLAQSSFEDAMKAAQAGGTPNRIAEVAAQWKEGDSLEVLRNGLESIKQPDQRTNAFLKAALVTGDDELMKRAFEESEKVLKAPPTDLYWREPQLYTSAVLRERLNGAEDGKLALGRALAYTLQTHPEKSRLEGNTKTQSGRNDALSDAAAIAAQGSSALLREVLDSIDDGSGFKVAALAKAIPVFAKTHGFEAAESLLSQLETMPSPTLDMERPASILDPKWAYGRAVYEILPLIGPKSPTKAQELAQKIQNGIMGDDQRARALALAAQFQTPAIAASLYKEAIKNISTDDAPRIAALVWEKNRELGLELFSLARQRAEDEMKSPMHWKNAWVPFAFYFARVSPAQSRLILEREWNQSQRTKVDSDELALIALAMAPIDAPRAQEMASQIPNDNGFRFGNSARVRIARYLYADPATRQGFILNRIGAGAAWNPGPIQW